MKTTLLIILVYTAHLTSCQTTKYDKRIVDEFSSAGVLEAPFMTDELIEIYKKDTLCIKKTFNSKIFDRTEYTLYCYNICLIFFNRELQDKVNNKNKNIVKKMMLDNNKNITKPNINWAKVFETCQTCPFGEYPDDRFFYFKFSVMFMGEKEIKEMIAFENGEQWKYALMAIKGGDAFTLNKEDNYQKYVLDRRIADYIINRWKDCKISEIQDLIATYKDVM